MLKKFFIILCCIAYIAKGNNNIYTFNSSSTTSDKSSDAITDLRLESILRVDSTDGMTLKELLESANNNYAVQAQDLLMQQAQKDHLVSKLAFIPTLNATYNFNRNNTSVNIHYQTQNTQIAFDFKLDWADYKNMREKGATATKSAFDSKHTKQNIYLQVIQEYYTYFNNESNLITLQHRLQQLQSDVDRTQKLYNQGLRTIADLESLKSQASSTEYQIGDAQLALERSKLMLEYLTNTKIDKIKRVQINNPTYTLNDRNDIKSLEYQIQAQKFQNQQLHYYPIFNIRDTYTYNIEIPYFAASFLAQGGFFAANYATHQNVFSVVASYPIFAKIGQSVQKQALTLAQLANEKQLAYQKNEQKKDEELYRKAIELARNQIESAKAGLISANISYDNMKKRYDANLSTFTEYLQALSTKYDAESTFIQALNNYEIQKANYIFYSGQELEKYVN